MADPVVTTPTGGTPSPSTTTAGNTPAPAAASSSTQPTGNTAGTKTDGAGDGGTKLIERKVNGKMVKLTQEEWDRAASLGLTATERLQHAAGLTKKAEAALNRLKNPREAIKFLQDPELGLSKEAIREAFEEWYAKEFIEPSKMTPEQKRLRELEEENKSFKDKEAEREAREQAEKDAKEDEKTTAALIAETKEIIEQSGLPKTRFTAARVAYWTRVNESKGLNAPKEMIVQQVKKEAQDIIKSQLGKLSGEQIVSFLGDEGKAILKALRDYDIEQLKKRKFGGGGTTTPETPATKTEEERIYMPGSLRRLQNLK
jgi:hypothetical protein